MTRRKPPYNEYPYRCRVIPAPKGEIAPGWYGRTPIASLPHIGKLGTARLVDRAVQITLDDGMVLKAWECWWERDTQ